MFLPLLCQVKLVFHRLPVLTMAAQKGSVNDALAEVSASGSGAKPPIGSQVRQSGNMPRGQARKRPVGGAMPSATTKRFAMGATFLPVQSQWWSTVF